MNQMIVGLCTLELRLYWANSLKDKRREIMSLINRVRSRYNVSIAETGNHDQWRSAIIGFAAVSTDRSHIDSIVNEVLRFIEQNTEAEMVSSKIEII